MDDAPTRLRELVRHVRSKNAGPFWVTIDVFCGDESVYSRVVHSRVTDPSTIEELYGVERDDIQIFGLPELHVIKISFPRTVVQGALEDRDLHAGQQYVPLSCLEI
jgi:hypothetical protein